MPVVSAALCAVIGLIAGSGFHVLVHRTPMRQRATRPLLHCTTCGIAVPKKQRVPLIARVRKMDCCSECKNRLWPACPWLEIATAVLFAIFGARAGLGWSLPAFLVFAGGALVISVVDYRTYLIPNRVVYPTLFLSLALLVAASVARGSYGDLAGAVEGMIGAWIFYFLIWFTYPRGMGFGDVRLSLVIGLMAGWVSLSHVVLAIILGLVLGAASGVLLMLFRYRTRKDAIPFGPFMIVGAGIAIVAGNPIISWWAGSS